MKSMEAVCNNVLNACVAIWQQEAHAIEWIANESAAFVKNLQMAEDINQMQQNVIMLDVGGHVHHLSKQSVTRHRDSFFGALFSDAFNPAEQACTFVDRDGEMFCLVASHLRHDKWFLSNTGKKSLQRECVFYCLPAPPVPLMVCASLNGQKETSCLCACFLTESGEKSPCTQDLRLKDYPLAAASNGTSLYVIHLYKMTEYIYSSGKKVTHWASAPNGMRARSLQATSTALFALLGNNYLYTLTLDRDWEWKQVTLGKCWVALVSNNTLFAVFDNTIFAYNDSSQKWDNVCPAPPTPLCWIFIEGDSIYAQTTNGTIACKCKNLDWVYTTCTRRPESRIDYVVRSRDELHVFGYHEVWRYKITSNGLLIKTVDHAPGRMVGFRTEY